MSDGSSQEFLARLCRAAGPPGAEDEVRTIVREALAGVGPLRHDRLGSVLCERRGSADAPRVVVDCHLDEVGFLVQSIGEEGRVGLVPLGTWWGHVLLGQRIEVLTEGARVPGVIAATPPHFLSPAERERVLGVEQMTVDVGACCRSEVEDLGVRVGDPVIPAPVFSALGPPGVFGGKAIDNRVGVALMCEVLVALTEREHPNTVIGVGAVQEELGARGAGTASAISRPDVALVLECTPADDVPGQLCPQAVLGGGPQVRLFDPTAVANRRLARFVASVAADAGIAVQTAVRRSGGTDAAAIHRHGAGVPAVVIGVPGRYIHSPFGLLQWRDYCETRRLVLELIARMDDATVAAFTRFD